MTKDLQKCFNVLVNGEGTRYAVILDALRNNLQSDIPTTDGCIAFYNYDIENTGTMLMKVFPYRPEVISSYFPSELETQLSVLERINADRPYSEMHHLKNFRCKFKTKSHFNLTIPDKEVLVHDKKKINDKTWAAFAKDKKVENNVFDNLLFPSEEQSFQIFPLPVLSSPCMLLIIPASEHINAPDMVAAKIRESIDFYLYNRLLNEISKDLKPGLIKDKTELVERFLRELSQVAIPIKYEFNRKYYNCFDWYGNWKTDTCATVELTIAAEPVKIFMPTFCWLNGEMIHKSPQYDLKVKQVTETIQNIFSLVYNYWQTINSKKLLVQSEISPLISELRESVAGMKAMKTQVEDKISEQTQKVETLSKLVVELGGDTSQPFENEFYFSKKSSGEKVWKIRYTGIDVIVGAEDKGYDGLHLIMMNKNTEIDVSMLGADGSYIQQEINDTDLKNTLNNYKSEIEMLETKIKSGIFEGGVNGFKKYAENLAGYINCCKDSIPAISYTKENKKLNAAKEQLKGWMSEEDFKQYEKLLEAVAKQSKPNTLTKQQQDGILNPIRQLVKRLKKEQDGILAPLLEDSVLKIGVKSSFRPKGQLDVIWKAAESQTEPE